jgi:hypothetical protein
MIGMKKPFAKSGFKVEKPIYQGFFYDERRTEQFNGCQGEPATLLMSQKRPLIR